MATGVPAALVLTMLPTLADALIPSLVAGLQILLPFGASFLVTLIIALLGPILLAFPVAIAAGATARRLGKENREKGLAAAAGASMSATGVTALFLGWSLLSSLELSLFVPFLVTSALGLGIVGGSAFLAVPQGKKSKAPPELYQGLLAAGLGPPLLVLGAALWRLVSTVLPFLSAEFFRSHLPALAAYVLYPLLFLTAVTPLTYLAARTWRRSVPGLNPKAVGAGLMVGPLMPFLILSASHLAHGSLSSSMVALTLGNLLGAFPHVLAAYWGLRPKESLALPEKSAKQLTESQDSP